MCDTSNLLSNCFTQFCRHHSVTRSDSGKFLGSGEAGRKWKFGCPLCRGVIMGSDVLEAARRSMNGLVRNCSVDSCEFLGNYSDLTNHAESQHLETRPRGDVGEVAQVEELDGIVSDWADDLLQYVELDPRWEEIESVDNLVQYVDPNWEEVEHVDAGYLLHPVDLDGAVSDPNWEEGEFDSVLEYVNGPLDYADDWEVMSEGISLESLLDTVQFE